MADPILEEQLQRHEAAVAAFLARARQVPPNIAATPRAPGKWTPIEEVSHLALTYREFAAALVGGPAFELLVPPDKAAEFRDTLVPRILAGSWFPTGTAAPERVRPEQAARGMPNALRELETALEDFHRAARGVATRGRAGIVAHPYFGPLPLSDLIGVLTGHANHHAAFLP